MASLKICFFQNPRESYTSLGFFPNYLQKVVVTFINFVLYNHCFSTISCCGKFWTFDERTCIFTNQECIVEDFGKAVTEMKIKMF